MDVYVLFAQRIGHSGLEALDIADSSVLEEMSLDAIEEEFIEDWENRFGGPDVTQFSEVFSAWRWVKVTLAIDLPQLMAYITKPLEIAGNVALPQEKGTHSSYNGITVTRGRQGGTIQDSEIL